MITCRVPSRQGIAVWVHATLVCTQGGILSDYALNKERMTLLTSMDTAKQITEHINP